MNKRCTVASFIVRSTGPSFYGTLRDSQVMTKFLLRFFTGGLTILP